MLAPSGAKSTPFLFSCGTCGGSKAGGNTSRLAYLILLSPRELGGAKDSLSRSAVCCPEYEPKRNAGENGWEGLDRRMWWAEGGGLRCRAGTSEGGQGDSGAPFAPCGASGAPECYRACGTVPHASG